MSTRATVHFCNIIDDKPVTSAIVYKHEDGDPSGLGEDLKEFLKEVKDNVKDNRFDDPNYLAAKFVVWQANKCHYSGHVLNFLGVGVCQEDPGDIEYRYKILCKNYEIPEIITEEV